MTQPRAESAGSRPVLFLAHVFPRHAVDPLGAFLLHLAQALGASTPVEVVAPHAPGLRPDEAVEGVPVHRFRYAPLRWERLAYTGEMHALVRRGWANKLLFALFNLAFLIAALRRVVRRRARVIHAHWWLPDGLVGALASLLTRTPLVITTHGTDVEQLRRASGFRPLARFVFGRAAAITCGSTFLRDQLVELGVVDRALVTVVPMPVGPLFVAQSLEARDPASAPASTEGQGEAAPQRGTRTPLILAVARLTTQKSIDTLIQAVALLRDRGCAFQLMIAGDGPARADLERLTDTLNLRDRVNFLGTRAQTALPEMYAACDVFVLPSLREGTGLVLAEALLCGAPVISTDAGGVTEIVRDEETGLTFPERDAPALADRIQRLWNDPALAARLAANGRAWVRDRFTPERVAAQFVAIYEQATHRRER